MSNCTDKLWLKAQVLVGTKAWFVFMHKINSPNDLDIIKSFDDYGVGFPNFLQLCDHLAGADSGGPGPVGPGSVNQALVTGHCSQRLLLDPNWRIGHQHDAIVDFVNAAVSEILHPSGAGTGARV